MKLRPFILPVALAAGLSSIYVLPKTGKVAQSAISMSLPAAVPGWRLIPIPPSQAEIDILDPSTRFSKAICRVPGLDESAPDSEITSDRIDLSIVLSGYDLNNSIHRPERCMPSQGHDNLSASTIPLKLHNGRTIHIRRLKSTLTDINPKDRALDRDLNCVTYYFFVGHDRIEYDHFKRTFADMKDRLVRGMDQRWAYVTASMTYGVSPWLDPLTEKDADARLTEFLTELAERQIDWEQVKP